MENELNVEENLADSLRCSNYPSTIQSTNGFTANSQVCATTTDINTHTATLDSTSIIKERYNNDVRKSTETTSEADAASILPQIDINSKDTTGGPADGPDVMGIVGEVGEQDKLSALGYQKSYLRTSTPLRRELVALNRSLNESKVLKEYCVTGNLRKLRPALPKPLANTSTKQPNRLLSGDSSFDESQPLNTSSSSNLNQKTLNEMNSLEGSEVRQPANISRETSPANSIRSSRSVNESASSKNYLSDDQVSNYSLVTNSKGRPRKNKVHNTSTVSNSKAKKTSKAKRPNMRSQNADFVQKQKIFLHKMKHIDQDGGEEMDMSDTDETGQSLGGFDEAQSLSENSLLDLANDSSLDAKLAHVWENPPKPGSDSFCFKCHVTVNVVACSRCIRSFHVTCLKMSIYTPVDIGWVCPECLTIDGIINGAKRGKRSDYSSDLLCQLLSFAIQRLKSLKGVYSLPISYPSKYVVNPVTLATIQEKNEKKQYRCAEELFIDCKWILHNITIVCMGGTNTKWMLAAKALVKTCRQETYEIQTCAECYLNANTRADWFVDVCSSPHLLLWAKLKGFPYWPCKVMGLAHTPQLVNVRFFGKHDRSVVSVKDCYLFCEKDPNAQTSKRSLKELAESLQEAEQHIAKIKQRIGNFCYAPFKTPYEPQHEMQQLENMMPGVTEYIESQRAGTPKPPLTFKIVKTADNNLSYIKKNIAIESGNESDPAAAMQTIKKKRESNLDGSAYEVVTKVDDDSKVASVILKRKSPITPSIEVETKAEELTVPPIKVSKCHDADKAKMSAESPTAANGGTFVIKRKHGELESPTHGSEKPKSKHSKSDTNGCKTPSLEKNINAETNGEHWMKSKQEAIVRKTSKESERTNSQKEKPLKLERPAAEEKKEELQEAEEDNKPEACDVGKEMAEAASNMTSSPSSPVNPEDNGSAKTESREITSDFPCDSSESLVSSGIAEQTQTTTTTATVERSQAATTGLAESSASSEASSKPESMADSAFSGSEASSTSEPTSSPEATSGSETQEEVKADNAAQAPCSALPSVVTDTRASSLDPASPSPTPSVDPSLSTASNQSTVSSGGDPKEKDLSKRKKSTCFNKAVAEVVPLIEVKQEPPDEQPTEETEAPKEPRAAGPVAPSHVATPVTALASIVPQASTTNQPSTNTARPSVGGANQMYVQRVVHKPILIKEEVLSEDESERNSDSSVSKSSSTNVSAQSSSVDEPNKTNTVRLVGETVIQKLPNKTSAAATSTTTSTNNNNQNPLNKRHNPRGIPYGPLPASAAYNPITSTSNTQTQTPPGSLIPMAAIPIHNIQQQQQVARQNQPLQPAQTKQQQQLQQRCRKSLTSAEATSTSITSASKPNLPHSALPPGEQLHTPCPIHHPKESARTSQLRPHSSACSTNTCSTTSNPNNKRSLLKAGNMVAIPVDAVSSASNVNLVPMPPLTAVSKVSVGNTITTNAAASLGNSASPSSFSNKSASLMGMKGLASTPPPLVGLSSGASQCATTSIGIQTSFNDSFPPLLPNPIISSATPTPSLTACSMHQGADAADRESPPHLAATLTPSIAAAVSEIMCTKPMPMLTPCPTNRPLKGEGNAMFQTEAGPLSRLLSANAHKLTDFFISTIKNTITDIAVSPDPASLLAKITSLELEIERLKYMHDQEVTQLKQNADLILVEMRKSMDAEKARLVAEVRKQCEMERQRAVEATKKKQWCATCGAEAQFYCCWNTSYCDYPCQQLDWSAHSKTCSQTNDTARMHQAPFANRLLGHPANALAINNPPASSSSASSLIHNQQPLYPSHAPQHHHVQPKLTNAAASSSSSSSGNASTTTAPSTSSSAGRKEKNKNQSGAAASAGTTTNPNTMASMVSLTPTSMATTQGELLKLPNNTYLRPVTSQQQQQQSSNSAISMANTNAGNRNQPQFNSIPIQRFNVPVAVNSASSLVQRGGQHNWEFRNTIPIGVVNTPISSPITLVHTHPSVVQQQQQQQQQLQQQQRVNTTAANANPTISVVSHAKLSARQQRTANPNNGQFTASR